ncbi:hypothetical protein [Paraburkholderia heleia]|uniref:hypothetical protein n=1 Tax=Paraburkholderia heleia TaxID=634127 RepID=UPI002AB7DC6B|nr:hypothetical protein [Paraburkholderia heleia]
MPKAESKIVNANAGRLIDYLAENGSATLGEILRERLMSAQEASEALRYCVRKDAVSAEKRDAFAPGERVVYSLTGAPLMREDKPVYSFEALLEAWDSPCTGPAAT